MKTMTLTEKTNTVEPLSEVIKVSDLEQYHPRQIRKIVVAHQIGDMRWRNLAPKEDLIKALVENFPDGNIPVVVDVPIEQPQPEVEIISQPANALPGLFIPEEDDSFIFTDHLREYLGALRRMTRTGGKIMNTILVGPQGCGKTSVAYEFAAKAKIPLLKMNCPLVREPRDWFGAKRAENGSVFWDKALFAEAVAAGGLVVLLDEITRATPNVLNSLLPLLDWTRETYIEEAKEKLVVGPQTYFFATANIGAQFTGTFRLDSALSDRFGGIVECSFLPPDDEAELLIQRHKINSDVAKKLVKIANMVRDENQTTGKLTETISTRVLLDVAQLYGAMKETAFRFTVLPKFSDDGGKQSERAQVLGFIQGQFPNF